jgi:hypothetical protein
MSFQTTLGIVLNLVGLPLPNCVYVCVTSCPEVDIKTVLDQLTIYAVSLYDQSKQMKGIVDYVNNVVTDRHGLALEGPRRGCAVYVL